MMDYEFRIKVAEEELAHLRKMQILVQAHQDEHDKSIGALGSRMDRAEADIAETAANLKIISVKLAELINALRHGERNGREEA